MPTPISPPGLYQAVRLCIQALFGDALILVNWNEKPSKTARTDLDPRHTYLVSETP